MWWHLHRLLRSFDAHECAACGLSGAPYSALCLECSKDAVPWPRHFCNRCGAAPVGARRCACPPPEPGHPIHISWLYEGAIADAIVRAKTGTKIAQAASLVPLAFQVPPPADFFTNLDAVVPIPPNPCRLQKSGFDPVSEFGAFVARALNIELRHRLILRDTKLGLKKGTRQERLNTAHDIYTMNRNAKRLQGARVLLLDDVRTTGATTQTVGNLLSVSGVREIRTWVLSGRASPLPNHSSAEREASTASRS